MTRADDERILAVVDWHVKGYRSAAIAAALGLHRNAVTKIIARIREADIAYDPEAAAYWRSKGHHT